MFDYSIWGWTKKPNLGKLSFESLHERSLFVERSVGIAELAERVAAGEYLRPNAISCLVGRRGSGKSATLRAICAHLGQSIVIDFRNHTAPAGSVARVRSPIIIMSLFDEVFSILAQNGVIPKRHRELSDQRSTILSTYHRMTTAQVLSAMNSYLMGYAAGIRGQKLANGPIRLLVDNIDNLHPLGYQFVLKPLGLLCASVSEINVLTSMTPKIRIETKYAEYRGPETDLKIFFEMDAIRASEIIESRLKTVQRQDKYYPLPVSQHIMRYFSKTDDIKTSLLQFDAVIDYAARKVNAHNPSLDDNESLFVITTIDSRNARSSVIMLSGKDIDASSRYRDIIDLPQLIDYKRLAGELYTSGLEGGLVDNLLKLIKNSSTIRDAEVAFARSKISVARHSARRIIGREIARQKKAS